MSRYNASAEQLDQWQASRRSNLPFIHPVIRTHPETGEKGIFVNESFTTKIIELSARESQQILSFLFEFVSKPEFSIRWKWKQYDIAFWDNRITQHYATADYLPHRRNMHRATILGDKPYFFK